jgi:hypothetical protein
MNDPNGIGIAEQSMASNVAGSEYDAGSLIQIFLKWLAFGAGVLLTFAWAGALIYGLVVLVF